MEPCGCGYLAKGIFIGIHELSLGLMHASGRVIYVRSTSLLIFETF